MSIFVDHKNNNVLLSGEKQQMFFASKIFRMIIYIVAAVISFLVLSVGVSAGVVNYSNIYVFDAVVENKEEVGVNDDIKIIFNQPVIFLDFDNIDISPNIDFDFSLSDDNKVLILSHNELFLNETKYEIDLKSIRGLSGLMMENRKFVFYTRSGAKNDKIVKDNKKEFFPDLNYLKINIYLRKLQGRKMK